MKNFFKSLGKALLYFCVFLAIQLLVSFVFSIVISAGVMVKLGASATEAQIAEAMAKLESEIMGYSTLIAMISNILSLAVVWLAFKIRKKKICEQIELRKCDFKMLFCATLCGISFSILSSTVVQMIPFPDSMVESFAESHGALSKGNPIVGFISVVFLAPIVEEIFFRGLIHTRLKKGMNTVAAAIVSSLLFGVMHGEIIWIMATFLMGIMLVWVFEKTKSLLPCISIHVLNNAVAQLTSEVSEITGWGAAVVCAVFVVLFVLSAFYIIKNSKQKHAVITETE